MISAINSSDNKRHITLASVGGIAWGSKEVYNTFSKIKESKNTYKHLMLGLYMSDKQDYKNQQKHYLPEDTEQHILSDSNKKLKANVEKFKSNCRFEIKKIKKFAPLKITTKILGGIAIGLGISLIISYIKDRKK